MNDKSYSMSFLTTQSSQEVFAAVNRVRDWWSGTVEGGTDKLGDTFTYTVPGVHYSKQRITEFVPGTKVVWHVDDANLAFATNKSEWRGTDIVFEIARKGDKTELRFTHRGLVPDFECHEACSNAWGMLVGGNLKKLIATGKPQPSPW